MIIARPEDMTLDPEAECWSCGYRMGDHDQGYPCPEEHQLREAYGR